MPVVLRTNTKAFPSRERVGFIFVWLHAEGACIGILFLDKGGKKKSGQVAEQSMLINPVAAQCYADESLVGVITGIWHKSTAGPHRQTIERHALAKWLTLVVLELDL